MAALPDRARVVIIGAGIVGNSMAWHLARLGWRDIVLLDKGALPNPGGSTGHASNFIFPTDHSKEMTALTLDSVAQYIEMGVFTQSGGIEVARTPERIEELKRRTTSSMSWGIETELLDPAAVNALVPYLDPSVILGGFSTPGVGVVDSLRAGTIMRERAQALGALTIASGTEVTGIDVVDDHVRGVRTDKGDIATDTVVIACGAWSPRIARMAGVSIPLTPAVHQMISVGPVPQFADTVGEITFPIVRDMDTNMYERQYGGDPPGRRRHPVDRAGRAVADGAAVHPGRLRAAAGAGSGACSGDPRRRTGRDPLRHQRRPVAHSGWDADPRRDSGGQGPLVGRRRLDQGGTRDRPGCRRMDDPRIVRDRPPRVGHRALLRPPEDAQAH